MLIVFKISDLWLKREGNKDFQKCVLLRVEQVRNCVKGNEPSRNTNAVTKLYP